MRYVADAIMALLLFLGVLFMLWCFIYADLPLWEKVMLSNQMWGE